MKGSRSMFLHNTANSSKMKISAKVWKIQVLMPYELSRNEKNGKEKTLKWIIYQVLN